MKATPNSLGHPHEGFHPIGELPVDKSRRMNLVTRESLTRVLRSATDRALQGYQAELRGRTLLGLRAAVIRELLHGLRTESRTIRGMTKTDFLAQLAQSRDGIVEQSRRAGTELENMRAELERQRRIAENRKDPAQLSAELEAKLEAIFAENSGDPETLKALVIEASKNALSEAAKQLATEEANDKKMAMLERRIVKLNSSLQNAEELIRKLSAMKDVESGVASLYRSVQGLSLDEDQAETKKEMLKCIFDANVDMRKQLRKAS